MTQDNQDKLGVRTNTSRAKSRTSEQRARKKLSATLLCILDTEDELSGHRLKLVPVPVRQWLTETFTTKAEGCRPKPEESAKPRVITQAVEEKASATRLFRASTSSTGIAYPAEVIAAFKDVDRWCFDVFALHKVSQGHSLKYMMCELFNKYNLLTRFQIPLTTMIGFAEALEAGYSKYQNPYHNAIHAADVTQTVHSLLLHTGTMHWFNDLEILAIFFSTCVHDYEHTGTTNNFHIQTRSEVALLYNDTSVLENHHLSAAYQLIQNPELNILYALTEEEWREMRQLVIKMVLGTDMSSHFQDMKNILRGLRQRERLDKSMVMATVVHVADLSHPAKPWELHYRWSKSLMEEFFKQGTLEAQLGLPISPLCDREATNIAESQIGFIDVIVKPVFALLFEVVQKIIVPFLNKASFSREPCRKSKGSTDAQNAPNDQTGNGFLGERGPCTELTILTLDIPKFKNSVMQNIQVNRNKWEDTRKSKKNGNNDQASRETISTEASNEQVSKGTVSTEAVNEQDTKRTVSFEAGIEEASKGTVSTEAESPEEIIKPKDHAREDKAHTKKAQKRIRHSTGQSKSKKYCTTPQLSTTCDCQLCDSTAFEPMDTNFDASSSDKSLCQQDSDAMEVTESYEELVDNESSWRKNAGQTAESNIKEMRALVPKTKPLSPNESDDVIIEEFIPDDDSQSQAKLTSEPLAATGQECPQHSSNVGFIMTDLTQSDMEIFSLWNEEVVRRALEHQKQGQGRMPADAPLQVMLAAKQKDCQGSTGASAGKPPETFVLQVISFDSPSVTYSEGAVLNCDPGPQVVPPAPTNDSVVPTDTSQQNHTEPWGAAAVSVTSMEALHPPDKH